MYKFARTAPSAGLFPGTLPEVTEKAPQVPAAESKLPYRTAPQLHRPVSKRVDVTAGGED